MMREDYYSNTEADAGAFEWAHTDHDDPDRPTRAELEREDEDDPLGPIALPRRR